MRAAPVRPGDDVVGTFPYIAASRALAGFFGLLTVFVGFLGVRGGPLVLPFVACFAGMTVVLWRQAGRPVVLTSSQLIAPRPLGGWRVVELATVAGVGLRYYAAGEDSHRWHLKVWPEHGPALYVPVEAPDGPDARTWTRAFRSSDEEERQREWRRTSDTAAGRAARRIAAQTADVQGPDGLLEQSALQVTGPAAKGEVAYWSPDGRIGLLHEG
jgi:hypothetical protein